MNSMIHALRESLLVVSVKNIIEIGKWRRPISILLLLSLLFVLFHFIRPQEIRPTILQIAAGAYHTCASFSDGTLKCWGRNGNGQLGIGTFAGSSKPLPVLGLASATSISTGGFHSCARLTDSQLSCWGVNDSGQLGIGGSSSGASDPKEVPDIMTGIMVSAGSRHSCALIVGATIKCWGANEYGQLGIGPLPKTVHHPMGVPGISTATFVAAGGLHSCALLMDKKVRCWGGNESGQLGMGVFSHFENSTEVTGITSAFAIAAGGGHSCAVLADGTVRCWGKNDSGQLGTALFGNTATLLRVPGISTAKAITAGTYHTCVLLEAGTVKCWGRNVHGELGVKETPSSPGPVEVPGVHNASALSAGAFHTCALLKDNKVKCWGANDSGQLGDGLIADRSIPVDVLGLD